MIEKLVNDYLLKEQEERSKRERSGKISPSQLGRCYRYQLWNRKNEIPSNPTDILGLRKFAVGKIFHNWIQDLLVDVQSEVMVEQDDIFGYADLVTPEAVIDLKTTHSKAFWYMQKETYDVNVEKYDNILQVCLYAMILKRPEARLCMISKDDLCMTEYGFDVEKWKPEVEKELKAVRNNWTRGELPPPEPRAFGKKECSWSTGCCMYRDKCFKLQNKEIPTK